MSGEGISKAKSANGCTKQRQEKDRIHKPACAKTEKCSAATRPRVRRMVPQVFPEGAIRKSFAPGEGDWDGQSFLRRLPRPVAETILRRARVVFKIMSK